MQDSIQQWADSIRLADVLDVGVIAILLYWGLVWFRERATRSMVVALLLAAGLFACARWLDMYLTTMLFRAGSMALLFALIVVFQQDIRRALDRLAASHWLQRSRQPLPASHVVDALVESTATFAKERVGALIVLEGREPPDTHLRGGIPVGAHVSLPLLYSIFHPGSPGHDGAVLIRGERIGWLGVHLPLSTRLSNAAGGTRHAAALGLAERCDALVVVVSEERGTISVAHRGQIREVDAAELTSQLQRHYRVSSASPKQGGFSRSITRNGGLKLAALAIACGLWFLLAYRVDTIQRTYIIPIEYRNLPEDWTMDDPRPTHAELTLSGSERTFDMLDADALTVSLDVASLRPNTAHFFTTERGLQGVPNELTVSQIKPREIPIVVRQKIPDGS